MELPVWVQLPVVTHGEKKVRLKAGLFLATMWFSRELKRAGTTVPSGGSGNFYQEIIRDQLLIEPEALRAEWPVVTLIVRIK